MDDLWRRSAQELASLVASRKVSAREAVSASLARLDQVNGAVNAVVDHRPDEALARADAIDRAIAKGENVGPMAGVPVTVKVNIDQKGYATTNGVRLLRDNIALFQDASVQLLGVSADPKAAQRVWAEQEGFDFPLLSDFWPHGAVASAYGVFLADRGIATRATFVIDGSMTIRAAFVNPPSEPRPLDDYRKALAALG